MESRSLQISDHTFQFEIYGSDFILMRSENDTKLQEIAQAIYNRNYSFIEEIIATNQEICLKLTGSVTFEDLKVLENLEVESFLKISKFKIPVLFSSYDDWQVVTDATSLSREEYIAHLINTELNLSMYGFLPGFLYMNGLPDNLQVARKSTPSKKVKAGSIAVGGPYLGFYNYASPGGWNIIGHCPLSSIEMSTNSISNIPLGSQLEIISIEESEFKILEIMDQSIIDYNT